MLAFFALVCAVALTGCGAETVVTCTSPIDGKLMVRLLPAGSALVVTALGMAILFEALGQVGLLR